MIGAYVVGVPGSGKSTLLRALLPPPAGFRPRPVPHLLYATRDGTRIAGAQIGADHPRFPGTDRLSMAIQPQAIEWLQTAPVPVLVGEGDRLSTESFLRALVASTTQAHVVWLDTPPEVAAERRAKRGSAQSEQWLRGRETKVRRLVDRLAEHVIRLDGSLPLETLVRTTLAAVPGLEPLGGTGRSSAQPPRPIGAA